MSERQPTTDHKRFDALCHELEEYASLPSVPAPMPADTDDWHAQEHPEEALDDQILGALITPA